MSVANPPLARTRPASAEATVRCASWGSPLEVWTVRHFEYTQVAVPVPGLPAELEGLRICHISDPHFRGHWFPACDELLRRLAGNVPDLVLITGDFVDSKVDPTPALPHVRRLLGGIQSRLGTFAILGNHDGDLLATVIKQSPVTLLDGQTATLRSHGAAVEIVGLPGPFRTDLVPEWIDTVAAKPADTVRIVLSHYPDLIRRTTPLMPDLFLCGHTHGGQICLPGRYPIQRHDSLPRSLIRGVAHRVGETWLINNRGLGYSDWPVRIFCPAEVVEITLVRGTRDV